MVEWGCWEGEREWAVVGGGRERGGGGIWVTGSGGAGRRKGSCWSEHYCGGGEIQKRLLREQTLLRQWGNTEKAPAGAGTAAAVRKNSWGGLCGGVGG